jgi:hypothetical protein
MSSLIVGIMVRGLGWMDRRLLELLNAAEELSSGSRLLFQ